MSYYPSPLPPVSCILLCGASIDPKLWEIKKPLKLWHGLFVKERVKDITGIESTLWFSFHFRIQGLPNTDSLIFLLFLSSHSSLPPILFSSEQHCQVSHFYEKADCHIGLTGPVEEELQKLSIPLFYYLNSNEFFH